MFNCYYKIIIVISLFLDFHELRFISKRLFLGCDSTFVDNLSQNYTYSFTIVSIELITLVEASVGCLTFFFCPIKNVGDESLEGKLMLLHGDILLNEGAEPLVGVGDFDWFIFYIYCHNIKAFQFILREVAEPAGN